MEEHTLVVRGSSVGLPQAAVGEGGPVRLVEEKLSAGEAPSFDLLHVENVGVVQIKKRVLLQAVAPTHG